MKEKEWRREDVGEKNQKDASQMPKKFWVTGQANTRKYN